MLMHNKHRLSSPNLTIYILLEIQNCLHSVKKIIPHNKRGMHNLKCNKAMTFKSNVKSIFIYILIKSRMSNIIHIYLIISATI